MPFVFEEPPKTRYVFEEPPIKEATKDTIKAISGAESRQGRMSHPAVATPDVKPIRGLQGPTTLSAPKQEGIRHFDFETALRQEEKGVEQSWIDLPSAAAGGFVGPAVMGAGIARSLISSGLATLTEYPIGMASELVEKKHPYLALPFAVITGIASGVTLERAIENKIIHAFTRKGVKPAQEAIDAISRQVKSAIDAGQPDEADRLIRNLATADEIPFKTKADVGNVPTVEAPKRYVFEEPVSPPKSNQIKLTQKSVPSTPLPEGTILKPLREFDASIEIMRNLRELPDVELARKYYATLAKTQELMDVGKIPTNIIQDAELMRMHIGAEIDRRGILTNFGTMSSKDIMEASDEKLLSMFVFPNKKPPAPFNIEAEQAIMAARPPKGIDHPKIRPDEKINAITLDEAGKLIAKGDTEVIHSIQEGVQAKGSLAMQDAIRNEEMKVIQQAHKGPEREAVKAHIQEIEPEIDKALKGEIPVSKVEQIKIVKDVMKFTPSQRQTLQQAIKDISSGELVKNQGLKDPEGYFTGETLQGASMYPEYFKNKGYTSKEVLGVLKKALNGQPLTKKQQVIVEDINQGIREQWATGLKEQRKTKEVMAWDLQEGDKLKRHGETYTVKTVDDTEFEPKVVIKNSETLELKGSESIKYDRGTLKKGEAVPPAPEPAFIKTDIKGEEQAIWRGKGFDAEFPTGKKITPEERAYKPKPKIEGQEDIFAPTPKETEKQEGLFAGKGMESGALGFQPKGLFRRLPSTGDAVSDIQRRSTIVKDLSEMLGVPIRTGKFKGRALGIFKVKPDVVRSREALDIETISHEVGHHLHKHIFGITRKGNLDFKPLNTFRDELEKIATQPRAGQSKLPEGFAEFTRLYVTNDIKARKVAPKFYQYFDDRITKEYPEVKEVLLKARADYDRWLKQPAVARILSQISTEDKTSKGIKLDDIYTAAIDDLHPIKVAVDAMTGGQDIVNNPYKLARLSRGWWGKVDHFLSRGTLDYGTLQTNGKSLQEILKPIAKDLDNFRAYAISKRAMELHARGKKTGILPQDAKVALSELNKPEYHKAWQELQDYQDAVLRYLRDSGMVSPKLYKQMKELNKNYIPFYRIVEDMDSPTGQGAHKFADLFQPVKRIKGSTREIVDPLESVIKNTYTYINIAERNAVGEALVSLAEKTHGAGKYVEKLPTPTSTLHVNVREAIEAIGKTWGGQEGKEFVDILSTLPPDVQGDIISIFRPSLFVPKDEPIVTVWKNGEKALYRLDKGLYEAMLSLNREQSSWLVRALSFPAKLLRAGATLTPEFSLRNPLRDQFMATVQSKYGFVPGVDFVRGLYHMLKRDDLYWKFKAGGAEHSMLVSLDRDYLQKNLKDLLSDRSPLIPDEIRPSIIKHPIELLRVFSELGEMSTRLGEFSKGVAKEGISKEGLQKAAFAAREVTLDFARLGGKTQAVNMITAFWNARMQGLDKIVRTFKDNPADATAKSIAIITIPSVALWMVNKDDPRYRELPQWQKDLFWIVITDEHVYRIPKPFELGILFGSFPERILDYMYQKDPKAISQWANSFIQGIKPGVTPTIAVPLIENFANWSMFTDRPIVPKATEGLEPEYQATPYTSEMAKKIGETIGYSPAKIDNLIRGYTGGLGVLGVNAVDKIMSVSGITDLPPQPTKTLSDIPGIRAFTVRYPSANSESIKRFYDEYIKSGKAVATYNYLDKSEDKTKVQAYADKHRKELLRSSAINQVAKDFSNKHKLIQGIYNSRDLTPEQKREAIDKIYLEQIAIAQEVMEFIKEAK